jgi:hypothetical protein
VACSTRLHLSQDAGLVLPPLGHDDQFPQSQLIELTPGPSRSVTEAVVRDPIRAIEYKSQFVGQQETGLNEAALRRTHSRVAELTVE